MMIGQGELIMAMQHNRIQSLKAIAEHMGVEFTEDVQKNMEGNLGLVWQKTGHWRRDEVGHFEQVTADDLTNREPNWCVLVDI